jgi:hypothetical protein
VTVVAFVSLKGAPGLTTAACLVGAVWPADRRVMVVECDPAGGDLAARFGLSAQLGWTSFLTAVRRGGSGAPVMPHLQQLPGGVDVLVGTQALDTVAGERPPAVLIKSLSSDSSLDEGSEGGIDVLADAGRIRVDGSSDGGWLDRADVVAVFLRTDAASVLRLREHADSLRHRCGRRVGLVLVGGGPHRADEVEEFVGIPVIGALPHDPGAAAVASGEVSGRRRLARSALVTCARRLAEELLACSEHSAPHQGSVGVEVSPPTADRDQVSDRRITTTPTTTPEPMTTAAPESETKPVLSFEPGPVAEPDTEIAPTSERGSAPGADTNPVCQGTDRQGVLR